MDVLNVWDQFLNYQILQFSSWIGIYISFEILILQILQNDGRRSWIGSRTDSQKHEHGHFRGENKELPEEDSRNQRGNSHTTREGGRQKFQISQVTCRKYEWFDFAFEVKIRMKIFVIYDDRLNKTSLKK